ncbi:MAG: cobalamin biosynthesis protein [Arenibacterium sp.]
MIVAGFGFRKSAKVSSLRDALASTGAVPDRLATVSGKVDHPAIVALAEQLNLQVVGVGEMDLSRQETLTRSVASDAAYGTGSVAEAAALFAAGTGAVLSIARCVSEDRMATCAIARGEPE